MHCWANDIERTLGQCIVSAGVAVVVQHILKYFDPSLHFRSSSPTITTHKLLLYTIRNEEGLFVVKNVFESKRFKLTSPYLEDQDRYNFSK